MSEKLIAAIRDVPNFPQKGIVFKDITPILSDGVLLRESCDALMEGFSGEKVDKIVGLDARGFIFGAAIALELGVGFVPIRKKGKLPYKTYQAHYTLEYGENIMEVHKDALEEGENVVIIDDILATGGTASASIDLINNFNVNLVAISFLIELTFLKGRSNLNCKNINSIITY